MSRARKPLAKEQRQAAKAVGVTPAGLGVLARLAAGKAVGVSGGNAGLKLLADGLVIQSNGYGYNLTQAGIDALARARELGW